MLGPESVGRPVELRLIRGGDGAGASRVTVGGAAGTMSPARGGRLPRRRRLRVAIVRRRPGDCGEAGGASLSRAGHAVVDAIEPADVVLTDGSAEALPGAPIVGLSGAEGDFAGLLPVGAPRRFSSTRRCAPSPPGSRSGRWLFCPNRGLRRCRRTDRQPRPPREIEVLDRTRRRTEQQGNRAAARHLAAHRQIPPRAAVSQARRRLPRRSGRQGPEASDRRSSDPTSCSEAVASDGGMRQMVAIPNPHPPSPAGRVPLSRNAGEGVERSEAGEGFPGTALGSSLHPFAHHRVAQDADAGDLDLDRVAVLDVFRGALGAHPHHVARVERHILRHPADEGRRRRTACGRS